MWLEHLLKKDLKSLSKHALRVRFIRSKNHVNSEKLVFNQKVANNITDLGTESLVSCVHHSGFVGSRTFNGLKIEDGLLAQLVRAHP